MVSSPKFTATNSNPCYHATLYYVDICAQRTFSIMNMWLLDSK